ncbi:MAG TPA: thiol reductant ABC exporter subunit CydC [Actinoplanes sp.]
MKPIDPRLLRHARHSRGGIALLAAIGVGQALATVAVAVALTLFLTGSSWPAVILLAVAFAVRAALAWAEQVVAHRTAASVSDELRRSLVRAVARRGPAWVAGFGSGRLTALLTSGLDALRPWFAGYLPAVLLGAALPPLVLLAIFSVDPASAVIALATLPLIPLLGALIGWATQARAEQRRQADARLAGHFLDVVRGLATLRTFGRAGRQTAVIEDLTDRHRAATLRVLRVAFLSSTALDLVGTLSVGLIAVSTGLRVAAGHLSLAPGLLIILLAPEVYRPLREMAARYHAAADATAVIADVDEVLADLPAALPAGDRPGLAAAGLRVRYPGATYDALSLPELVVGAGEIVALTGPSGAGKTTALRALAGLQPLDGGTIALDGAPIFVPQSPSLPHARVVADLFPEGTPAVDIDAALRAVGLDAPSSETHATPTLRATGPAREPHPTPSVRAAGPATPTPEPNTTPPLRWAGSSQPPGYDDSPPLSTGVSGPRDLVTAATPLGEHGAGVSAGQRHRLALAAALFLGPATLLLDEPTAHLDPQTEQLVITRLRRAADEGSAILVAAHRPAQIAAADRIVEITPAATLFPAGPEQARDSTAASPEQARGSTAASPQQARGSTAAGPEPARGSTAAGPEPARNTNAPGPHNQTASEPARGTNAPATDHQTAPEPATNGLGPDNQIPEGAGRVAAADGTVSVPRHGTEPRPDNTAREASPMRDRWRRPWVAVALGSGSSLAGLVLTGAAAWLLIRAAALPPVLTLSAAVVLVRGSAVARPLLRYVERLVSHDVAFAQIGQRRARVYEALIPRVPSAKLRRRGDLLTKVVDDVDAQIDGLLRGRLPARAGWIALALGAGTAALVAPATALPVGAGLLTAGVLAPVLAAHQATRQDRATSEARAELRDAMVETVDGIEELRGSGLLGVPDRRSRKLADREARAARSAGGAGALAHLGWGFAVTAAALALGHAGLGHEWTGVVLLGLVVLGESALGLPEAAVARMRAAGAEQRLTDLLAEPVSVIFDAPEIASDPPRRPPTIKIRGLEAGWGDNPAFKGLDLDLEPGTTTAITGRSGAGKSTLGMVLARLLDPRNGTITVDGEDIRTLPEEAVRRRIVLIGDDTNHIFASTVRENLRLARPAAADQEIRRAIEKVQLGAWLDSTPDGLDTWLGTGGSTISGGQARRLATARALLADPDLLILDEPTEGLDEPTAHALMTDLLEATGGRTVLVLTHRTEGLEKAEVLALT